MGDFESVVVVVVVVDVSCACCFLEDFLSDLREDDVRLTLRSGAFRLERLRLRDTRGREDDDDDDAEAKSATS